MTNSILFKINWQGEYTKPSPANYLSCSHHFFRPFVLLLLLFLAPSPAKLFGQNDTPCECAQRWTAGAAWNPNGTVNENPPPMSDPYGIVKCGSGESIQSSIMTQFGCTYNPAAFQINMLNCVDPITGLPVPSPTGPTTGAPIIFLNFDLRPNVGAFQIQINENNMMDNIGWALYYSASPTTGTGPAPQYKSGDCNNLVFYHCGEASGNNWQTIFTPFFTEATNWYLAVWDQDDDGDLMLENFKGRFGCGDGDLYCSLETGTLTTTCNSNGTYTVNLPIAGQNGNYIGTDPNALNSPSAGICLTNTGDGGPTTGIISLTYNYGTPYDIDISIDINGPCPDPILPGACTANIVGNAPDCCIIPPSCTISGPAQVCPLETGILYSGPPNMDSYLWTITGNGSIVGSSTGQTVSVSAAAVCGGGYVLTLQVEQFTCINTCMLNVIVDDDILPSVTCPTPVTITSCPTQITISNTFNTWINGFSAMDNCGSPSITGISGVTAPNACGGTSTVNYSAMDNCGNTASCSSSFTISPPASVNLTCPLNVTEAACQSQQVIHQKYTAWLATAMSTGGCNAVLTNDSPATPSACGESRTVVFTLNSSCQSPVMCSATFTVNAAPAVVLTCPTNITEAACQTQNAIDNKYSNWLATVTAGGGCNGVLTNNNTGAPAVCTGGTSTVTFTYTSSCAPFTTTCQATFTVAAPANVVLTCPINQIEAACQTQAAINAKYNTWLTTVSASGGCNGVLTNNSTTPPDACGGSRTVTFTYTSTCAPLTTTCQATFTVNSSPAVLTCPVNTTIAACQTQAAVNTAYADWLASVTVTGGCNGVLTNNSTGAPDACGGSKTVTFTYTSTCAPLSSTCSATFTVPDAPVITLNCPAIAVEAACQSQAAINTKYNNWLNMANFSGGCNGFLTNNSTGAPSACGGVSTVTFTVTQSCGTSVICTRSFTVGSNPVQLTCPSPVTEAACQTQAQINTKFAAWLATVSTSGGCNPVLSNDNSGAPPACGGSTTVTFTVNSSCEVPKTCAATFAVANAPVVTLTCPVNQSEVACQTQGTINTKYANWLATVSASGGCNGVLTNNSTGAPDVCTGGTLTVTFTYTSDCPPVTSSCTATFTVNASPVILTCPANTTEAVCQPQTAIDTKYATWLATVSASGGCNGVLTNNSTGAPDACGGSKTVTFTYTNTCSPLTTSCSATFTVNASPVLLNCPVNSTTAACQTQAQVNAAYATWLASVSASGGCNGVLTNNSTGAPAACGGSKTVIFTYTSACSPLTSTCSATFTVQAAPTIALNCPVNTTTAACQTQAAVNAAYATWLASVTVTGGCNGVLTNNSTGAPDACGGSKTVTFTYTSTCAPLTSTCSATFTVPDAPVIVLNCPAITVEAACQTQAAINVKYANWLNMASFSGGCNGVLSNNNTGTPSACGGVSTVTFTVTQSCGTSVICTRSFTVESNPVQLTCPTPVTEAACQTQAQINTKFAAWLATVSTSGGCSPVLSNNNSGAPPACGGSTTVTFTVNSSCEAPKTCSATFAVANAPAVTLTCPANQMEASCQTQGAINTKFTNWLATVSASGGCNGVLTNNSTGAPDVCTGGTASVTFTYTSNCPPVTSTCTATFTVAAPPPIVLNCPANQTEAACQTQVAINAKYNAWLASVSGSGGCTGTFSNNSTGAPDVCTGGVSTVTFTYISSCAPFFTSCTATFTVTPPAPVALICPANVTEVACQSQAAIDAKFATWLASVSANGGCNGVLTNSSTTAPNVCTGGTATVTFTYASTCSPLTTSCMATFTVNAPATVTLTCPANVTEAACQTQAAIDAKFTTWLASVSATGGCNGLVTNNNTGTPNSCGGTTTVTFTYNSSCAPLTSTCSATFTVEAPIGVVLTCPGNVMEGPCQTQAAIDAKYNAWLASVSASNGCSGLVTNNSTGAPSACGGSKMVTFTYASLCSGLMTTCQATFTVEAAPTVAITCPGNSSVPACQNQAAVDNAYAIWLATTSASGGCNGVLTNNSSGAPSACGGSKTVTFTYTSSCTPLTTTCTATFTITASPVVALNCPANTMVPACQSQAAIDNAYEIWLATASASGGCNGALTNNSTGAPSACGGSKTVTFTYTSSCAPLTTTCMATFTVDAPAFVALNCPVNTTAAACQTQAQIDGAYAIWLATASANGGCNGVLSNNSTGAPLACGGSKTVTFTYTSNCAPFNTTCDAIFTVPAAPAVVLNCPVAVMEVACQTQTVIDNKYAAWLASATVTGGCNAVLTNNNPGSPSACGGSSTVTFTVMSSCEGPVTCTSTFAVTPAPPVVLNCPAPFMMPPLSTQAQIDAAFSAWLATANSSGGCGILTNDNTGAPSSCGGSTTVTFTFTSSCAPITTTSCSETFSVPMVAPGIGVAKYFAGIETSTSGIPGNFDVITEIIVQNLGSTSLNNQSLVDNLGAATNLGSAFVGITGAPQIVAVGAKGATTTADINPTINPAFNGNGNNNLLNSSGLLMPGQRYVLQFRFEVNPDAPGAPAVMKNQAVASGNVSTCSAPMVVSDLSDEGDNPMTSNAGWVGNSGGSDDPTLLTNCWSQLNSSIACNDLLQVSLNQNCEIWLTPGMVLEGETQMCINPNFYPLGSYYEVMMVTDANGALVPDLNPATPNIYEISGSYIGQYLTVKIRDKVYKNSCWGQIFIEDKLAPVFNCPSTPVSVFCTANLANVPPPTVIDNCDPNPIVTLVGQQVIDNDICFDGIYTVRRTYKATDNHGNMNMVNCVQNINVTRPPVDFPDDITWSCTQYSAHSNIVNSTSLHPTITDVDPVELGIDVIPSLPDTTLAHTGSGIVNVSVSTICKYNVLHSDQTFGICGTSFKIIRTWTVIDWCTGDIITTGVGGEDNVQVIKIADKVAPTITRAPFNVSINVPAAYPQPCKSTGILLPPTISDNCNAVTVQIITTVGEAIYLNGVDGKNGGTIPSPGLGIGMHPVTYIATDACGNSTTITVPVTVLDDVTPTAVCVSFTEVDLPSGANPTATVLANVFNTGSTDNCCIHHFEVRRMEDPCNDDHDDTVFGPSVKFCCEDVANSPIMVVFRAFDCFGNFNDCMVQVNVNDKQPPVLLTCPANQRITCDLFANNYETQLAALGNNQTAKSQLLDAMFGQPTFADNCTSITVTRTFASSFTQCKEGTMTRTWKAADAQGQESSLCSQTVFVDHVSDFVVNFPADITVNCGQSLPNLGAPTVFYETCEMVAINHEDGLFETVPGACYKFIRTWTVINWCAQGAIADQEVTEAAENALGLPFPACDLDGDGDCDNRTFRDSWTATQKPTANQANQQFGPDTDPDSDPWDGYITYKQTIMVIDIVNPVFTNCSIPDVCIQDTAVCAATFTLPQPSVMDCSSQVTITANTPGLGAGFGPFSHGPGTFITTFTASDGCNNTSICKDTFEIKDCKAPNIYCTPLIAVLMPGLPPMVPVNAQQLNDGTTDNCSDIIKVSFSPNVNDSVRIFLCEDRGVNDVQIWFTDESGNQDFCMTTVTIQDNTTSCNDDTLVVHLGGQIFNENDVPVSGVTVSLNGTNSPVLTGATGSFYFPSVAVGQDVTLVPNKDDNPLAGVSTYDIVKMSKHILNIELLDSPYKMIAADVNNSKTITTFDLVEVRKLILHINSNFPSNSSWRFVEKAYNFPVPTNPWFEDFPEIININDLPAEVLDADFVAVKIGDVNASYSFAGDETEDRRGGTLIFATQNQTIEAGQTCSLSFRAKDFEAVGYQFTLDFDADKLDFVEVGEGVANASNFGFAKLEEGAITASWNEHGERSEELADFTLIFRAKKRLKPSDAIWFSDRFTRTEAYSEAGDLLDIRLQFTDNESVGDFELFQNRPNPFSKETVIGFRLPEAGKAQLTITDATGKLVKMLEATCAKGYNEFRLNRDELGVGTGILYYRLAAGAETATRMMILTE